MKYTNYKQLDNITLHKDDYVTFEVKGIQYNYIVLKYYNGYYLSRCISNTTLKIPDLLRIINIKMYVKMFNCNLHKDTIITSQYLHNLTKITIDLLKLSEKI